MVLGIDLRKSKHLQSTGLRWRLLLSFMTVMMAILGVSALAVYQYTRRSLYDRLDLSLEELAREAVHNLLPIKARYVRSQTLSAIDNSKDTANCYLDDDNDLDLSWQQLPLSDRGVEWFDAHKKLVGKAGTLLNQLPPQPGQQSWQQNKIRAITIPVYNYDRGNNYLEGYIRSSQMTQDIEIVLDRLLWGLGVGGIGVVGLTGLGGIWLTRQSLKPIEHSFQQLQQFTADAAHELRSPLAAMKTSVQVMQYYPERIHPQDWKKIIAIASTTDHMIRLVEDLLLLARMDRIDIAEITQWSDLSLTKILADLLELFQSPAREKNITLQTDILAEVKIKGDRSQITRLFRNLLDNALQYTPSGGIVTLQVKRHEHNVIVSIEDTGIGIAPENIPFIFDRFWRADKARSRRYGGMGMGLAIAKAIAEAHRGEISVISKPSIGTAFKVKLPLS